MPNQEGGRRRRAMRLAWEAPGINLALSRVRRSLVRVERPDGSSVEIQDYRLSDEPVMIPALQGVPPMEAFLLESGPCEWHSDYWLAVAGRDVMASRARLTVTPSGHVHVRSEYPASPIACE